MAFRCSVASLSREEPLLGTASTVRSFLLIEDSGPWGVEALRDARMPEHVKGGLRELSARSKVRVLLIRRHRGSVRGSGRRVFAAYADPDQPWLETTTVAHDDALLALDLDALGRGVSPGLDPAKGSLFCVCTHGRHDTCCAELGRPVARALHASHPEETWEVSHIGGDRFAGNVLVLPEGLYYGRVPAADAPALARAHVDGRLALDRLRGRSGLTFPAQVAEVALRRLLDETRNGAIRVTAVTRTDDATSVRLEASGSTYTVRVRRSQPAEEHQLTCRALRTNPVPAYDVVAVEAHSPSTGDIATEV
jgi:hypothetical protein